MALGPNCYQIGNKTLCTRKRISMLTGLKMSSLAVRCAFYRSEHNAKGEPRN